MFLSSLNAVRHAFRHRDGYVRRHVRALRMFWRIPLARLWRSQLMPQRVVAVTGSAGKSTTAALAARALATQASTRLGHLHNTEHAIAKSVLRTRRSHRFFVQEVSGHAPGAIRTAVKLLRHDIAVVTTVGFDHYKAFRSKEAIAREKSDLVRLLPADGVAVLNADDPLVLAMRESTAARVLTYGRAEVADIRLVDARSRFPERLTLTVEDGAERVAIATRLVGLRWTTAVLAALAAAKAAGVPLIAAAAALEGAEPEFGRDSVHPLAHGGAMILDVVKAPLWTFPSSLDILREARATRRTMVVGTISDYPGSSSQKYRQVAAAALEVAERVLFVGPNADRVAKLAVENKARLQVFGTAKELHGFLQATAVPGELVYLKCSGIDHLERLLYDLQEPIACWVDPCRKALTCAACKKLYPGQPTIRQRRAKIAAGASNA